MPIDFSSVEGLYGQASQATQDLAALTGAGGNLESILRDTISERFTNSPLTGAIETQRQKVMSSPADIRAMLAEKAKTSYLSPTQQQQVSSQTQAANVAPLMTLNDLMNTRTGSIADVLRGGLNAYNAQLGAKQTEATGLQQQATNQLNLLLQKSQEERADKELALKGASASNTDWLSALLSGGQASTPTEPKPMYSAGQVGAVSKGGEWKFNGMDWDPVNIGGGGTGLSALTPEVLAAAVISGDINPATAALLGKFSGAIPNASTQKKLDEDEKLMGTIKSLNTLKSKMTGIKSLNVNSYNEYNQTKDLVGMSVAKLYEANRLSDADRTFYLSKFPSYAYALINPSGSKAMIDNLMSLMKEKLNSPNASSIDLNEWEIVQ
jgi:hypothetical protein